MFNEKALRRAVILADKNLSDLADVLNIDMSTLYRKMKGQSDFTRKEIQIICNYLDLESPTDIFFADELA